MNVTRRTGLAAAVLLGLAGSACRTPSTVSEGPPAVDLSVTIDSVLQPRITIDDAGAASQLDATQPVEVVFVQGKPIITFRPNAEPGKDSVEDERLGKGTAWTATGSADLPDGGQVDKHVRIVRYDDFPGLLVSYTTYHNSGRRPVTIDSTYSQQYRLLPAKTEKTPTFWSFQGASYDSRPDWVLPLTTGYSRYNYQGMNAPDYGGGIPVVDVWTPERGLAIGHVATSPRLVALPIRLEADGTARLHLVDATAHTLQPGDSLQVVPTFVFAHTGDYFVSLTTYAHVMEHLGITFPPFPESSYEPIWCAWGYGRNFATEAVLGTIPKVKELGLDWVVLDDGWQVAEGAWEPVKARFPNGEADMKAFVDSVHAHGLKAKLWWVPFAADPGTDLEREHPDWFILDRDGKRQPISWWDSYYLCPAHPEVRAHTKQLVDRFIQTWGYDGLKIDGQHLNAVPPCYNPAHHHQRPTESVEAVPAYFKDLHAQAMDLKPYAVIELCPCGDAASFFNMPYTNQPVGSDPTSSWQVRTKGKTFKALMGTDVPYAGDHVELSDGGNDFASTVGIGGVVSTKFTWAPPARLASAAWSREKEPAQLLLSADREQHWKHWIGLYNQLQLARGTYLGHLYNVGFDRPEVHAIRKDDRMYYAFYADTWKGPIELRGLKKGTYRVRDYAGNRDLGTVHGPTARLAVPFEKHLLLEVQPVP